MRFSPKGRNGKLQNFHNAQVLVNHSRGVEKQDTFGVFQHLVVVPSVVASSIFDEQLLQPLV